MEEWDDLDARVAMQENNLLVLLAIHDMIVATNQSAAYGNERHTSLRVFPYYVKIH